MSDVVSMLSSEMRKRSVTEYVGIEELIALVKLEWVTWHENDMVS
jgi:hypothetical protein